MPQFEDLEQTLIYLMTTSVHRVDEVHIFLAPIIQLIIVARCGISVRRFSDHELTKLVDKIALRTLE